MSLIPGKEVNFGSRVLVLAALNTAAVKQYREQINTVFLGQMPDIELVSKLAHASLQRNYPDMTLEQVDEIVDYSNMVEVWETIMNLAGLVVAMGKMMRRVQDEMAAIGLTTP